MKTTISRFAALKNCSAAFNMPLAGSHSPLVEVGGNTLPNGSSSLDILGANLGASFTLDFWMMVASPPATEAGVLTWGSPSSAGTFPWAIYINSPTAQPSSGLKQCTVSVVRRGTSSSGAAKSETATTPTAVTCSTWHHFAFIRGPNSIPGEGAALGNTNVFWNIMVDGVLAGTPYPMTVTTSNQVATANPGTNKLYFGSENGTSSNFQGLISQMRVWNTALGASQIQSVMYHSLHSQIIVPVNGNPTVGGASSVLLASWQADEGFGGYLYDWAGSNTGHWVMPGQSGLKEAPGVWFALVPPRPPAMPASAMD